MAQRFQKPSLLCSSCSSSRKGGAEEEQQEGQARGRGGGWLTSAAALLAVAVRWRKSLWPVSWPALKREPQSPLTHPCFMLPSLSHSLSHALSRCSALHVSLLMNALLLLLLLGVFSLLQPFSSSSLFFSSSRHVDLRETAAFRAAMEASRYTELSCRQSTPPNLPPLFSLSAASTAAQRLSFSAAVRQALEWSTEAAPAFPHQQLTRPLILAQSNSGFAALSENWLRHLARLPWALPSSPGSSGVGVLLVALDSKEYERLQERERSRADAAGMQPAELSVVTWLDDGTRGGGEEEMEEESVRQPASAAVAPASPFSSAARGFFEPGYVRITMEKWRLLHMALEELAARTDAAAAGQPPSFSSSSSSTAAALPPAAVPPSSSPPPPGVLLMDVDVLPMRDPLAWISTLPICDAYFSVESEVQLGNGSSDGGGGSSGVGGLHYGRPARRQPLMQRLRKALPLSFHSGDRHNSSSSSKAALDADREQSESGALHVYINTGLAFFRSTAGSRAFVKRVAEYLSALPADGGGFDGDQPVANLVLERMREEALQRQETVRDAPERQRKTWSTSPSSEAAGAGPKGADGEEEGGSEGQPGSGCARYGSGFTFLVLSPWLFQNGKHAWEEGALPAGLRAAAAAETPFTRHYNFLGGTVEAKLAAMKLEGQWLLEEQEERELSCRQWR